MLIWLCTGSHRPHVKSIGALLWFSSTQLHEKSKSFSRALWAHRVALIFVLLAHSQTPANRWKTMDGASASHGMPICSPAFAGTH